MPSTLDSADLLFRAKPSVPVEQAITVLKNAIRHCQAKRTFASGEAVCRATRGVWTAVHQQALYDSVLLPSDTLSEVASHIENGIDSLKGVEVSGHNERAESQRWKIRTKFPESMLLRQELVTLLKSPDGLVAVAKKVNLALED